MIDWNGLTKEDYELIGEAVERATKLFNTVDKLTLNMDLGAVHVSGCKLDLQKLLDFPDFDFAHDIVGITKHIDRKTGKLGDCFLPRCAA